MQKTVIVLQGLPGSGKSTWARQFITSRPVGSVARVNNDDLVASMFPGSLGHTVNMAGLLARLRENMLAGLLSLPNVDTVIVDNTNLNPRTVQDVYKIAGKHDANVIIEDCFLLTPVEECIRRDATRPHPVGADVILGMASRLPQTRQQK